MPKTRELVFRKTPSLVKDIEKERSNEFTRLTPTDPKKKGEVATVNFIKDRINSLRESHNLPEDPKGQPKDLWTVHLSVCHRQIISNNPNFVPDIKARIDEIFDATNSHTIKKREELGKMFYRFTEEARKDFKSLTYDVNLDDSNSFNENCPEKPACTTRQDLYDVDTPIISLMGRMSLE